MQCACGNAMFIADNGMNSSDNREELAGACGQYLPVTRMAAVAEIKKEVLSQPGRYTAIKNNLQAKEVIIGDGERSRRHIPCYNPKEVSRYNGKWVFETKDIPVASKTPHSAIKACSSSSDASDH